MTKRRDKKLVVLRGAMEAARNFSRFNLRRSLPFLQRLASLQRTRFVDHPLEEAANRGVVQRTGVGAFGVIQHIFLAIRLIYRQTHGALQTTDFDGASRSLVEKIEKLAIDGVDAAAPIFDRFRCHHLPSLAGRLTPSRPARFKRPTRSPTASAAASADEDCSTAATIAEPTTAASAIPPSTATCDGSETPNPTAMGKRVCARTRRTSSGRPAGSASRV